jgi:hypothetical protein
MKTLITAAAVRVAARTAPAQGQFHFGNRVTSCRLDARVFSPDGVTPQAGQAYLAQACVGLTVDSREAVGADGMVYAVAQTPSASIASGSPDFLS